jgi:hypothetical protein
MATTVRIYLEQGRTRTFASALDWPGWARAGRGDEAAVEALLDYTERYAAVSTRAGVRFPTAVALDVVERVPGGATTDFGAPERPATSDLDPLSPAALRRQVALLEASWTTLAEVAAAASAELRKGPRGGGRDRDDVVRHVQDAERAYARKLGVRHPPYRAPSDVTAMRADLVAALLSGAAEGPWSPAYAIRRIAWHVLDHAWEIEDKTLT